ncbi:YeeE/YedE family protein [Pseudoduganella sp. FT25W]|uniref:YeeE/YedE family protein n=1 Tax=Duganella alba TaxID=2666081 RepID=A0A6L5QLB8_9BURK|nr:YeeE/YedE family protein [Duganella alba]MRX10509.1 YeeE/YedE family protein [Duganella alba]MRX18129.1 YeeE/YedE family protein [Duganella alba]
MTIDSIAFTPVAALAGGVLIGLAAALFAVFNGRIAGISGILGGLIKPRRGDIGWRVAFIAGLVVAPIACALVWMRPDIQVDADPFILIVAGLIVGFGTRMGSGCTSGHGVCGIARLSPRSLIATLTFMALGFLTVFVVRHL